MKLNERWLREWVNPPISTAQMAEQLTMAGLEVGAMEKLQLEPNQIRIVKVLTVEPHPNADRLRVCVVTLGNDSEALTIVCGAPNVRPELKVPLAMIGAKLPNDIHIKQAKIRGIDSFGMLCSASELGLIASASGLLELPEDAPIGADFAEYLQLPDTIFEIDLTPNRGDCLSLRGIAREVGVLNRCPVNFPQEKTIPETIADRLAVTVLAPDHCPRYVGRIIRNINAQARTPLWLEERLRRCGIRSINPVVDVTNYVMLELGQPMHAFDLALIKDEINVRMARPDEKITLLDGREPILNPQALVIADKNQALALAGIMGGASSGVSHVTQDIFIESAFFNPLAIAKTARTFQTLTDSSSRFERGVDPHLQMKALHRATELLLNIVGGQAGKVTELVSEADLPSQKNISLRKNQIPRILGMELKEEEVIDILQRLGMSVRTIEQGWEVKIPSYRFDLNLEVDLIEELARVYGYAHIAPQAPQAYLHIQANSEQQLYAARVRDLLVDKGYCETISYSFVDPNFEQLLDQDSVPLILSNPISIEMSAMRTSLWPGLINTALFNLNRQQSRVRIFEMGLCFNQQEDSLIQEPRIAGLATGDVYPEQWGSPTRLLDFFDIKNDLESLLQLMEKTGFRFKPIANPALHPGQSAAIYHENEKYGYIGQLHPNIQQKLEIVNPVYLFELNWKFLKSKALPHYQTPSKFPSVRRDIAIIVEQDVPIQEIRDTIALSAGDLLKHIQLFDVYTGEGIDFGKKSVALGLTFQLNSRTLVDQEIEDVMQKITNKLEHAFNAILRA